MPAATSDIWFCEDHNKVTKDSKCCERSKRVGTAWKAPERPGEKEEASSPQENINDSETGTQPAQEGR